MMRVELIFLLCKIIAVFFFFLQRTIQIKQHKKFEAKGGGSERNKKKRKRKRGRGG